MTGWVVANWKEMEERGNLRRGRNEETAAKGDRKEEGIRMSREKMTWNSCHCSLLYFLFFTFQKEVAGQGE